MPRNQKGFAPLILVLFIVLMGALGYLLLQNSDLRKTIDMDKLTPTPIVLKDSDNNWKIYTDTTVGYSISYPSSWNSKVIEETQVRENTYSGQIELSGPEGVVIVTMADGLGGGSCKSLGGSPYEITIANQDTVMCFFEEPTSYRWSYGCGDCVAPKKDRTTFSLQAQTNSRSQISADLITQILSTFKFTQNEPEDTVLKTVLQGQIRSALELYRADYDYYPETLAQLTPNYLATIPVESTRINYQVAETKLDYNLSFTLSDGSTFSLTAP